MAMDGSRLGVAISLATEERRLPTLDEYFAIESESEARWEFYGLTIDRATHTLYAATHGRGAYKVGL